MEAEVHLLGRVTYEGLAAAWPSREGEFADRLNSDKKVVVSTSLTDPEWQNTTVISDDVPGQIAQLKADTDGVILVAGNRTPGGGLPLDDLVGACKLVVFPANPGAGEGLLSPSA